MASEVISASTTGSEAAPADAPGTERPDDTAEVAANGTVPSRTVPETDGPESDADPAPVPADAETSQATHAAPAPAPAEAPQPADPPQAAEPKRPRSTPTAGSAAAPPSGASVRRRLGRLGAQRVAAVNPVLEPLIKTVRATHPKADVRLIERAYDVAAYWHRNQKRKSGDPYITHPLAVATILAELGMNTDTISAALLHDTVEDTPYSLAELRGDFGEDISALVDGVTKLDKVKYGDSAEAETVRKMVVAMSRDIRVLVIKLADRLHNMRTLRYLAREKQERKSRETLEIFAPLAHRLGMNTIKWELEDLAFATMYPKRYDEIARLVSERSPRRDVFLQEVIEHVSGDLREAKISSTVSGRPKHYYSIYQKMIARNVGFDDIYDLVGIRVLVDSVRDCYAALGTIHARWNPVPGRFKDYIAMPKFNMYQSLHTTVIGPGRQAGRAADPDLGHAPAVRVRRGRALEVQGRVDLRQPGQGRRQQPGHGLAAPACGLAAGGHRPGRVPRVAALRPGCGRGVRVHPARRGHRAAAGRHAGRLRLRHPHRGRAPHDRGPGQRPAGRPGEHARQRRHGGDLHLQGPGGRAEPGLAPVRQERPGPQQDPAVVLQGAP